MDNFDVIKLSDFGQSLGTREFGKKLRDEVLSSVHNGHKVLFDFSKISLISSGFADELFGKLFVALGEEGFKNNIKVNRFDNDRVRDMIILIINKSIMFRKQNAAPA